jgi:hypothetical protein
VTIRIRQMRARKRSRCDLYGKWVLPGQRITKLSSDWVHTDCVPVVAAVRPTRADDDDRSPIP